MHSIWELILRFLPIGFFSIGGGYATIPLIQEQLVDKAGWLEIGEYMDIITISQMTPGPLAVNVSTFVGLRLGGVTGAIAATLGCIVSGVTISLLLRAFFRAAADNPLATAALEALKAASVGLIACAALIIIQQSLFNPVPSVYAAAGFDIVAALIFAVFILLLRKYQASPTLLLLLAGVIGAIVY